MNGELLRTLYRTLLRSSTRVRKTMRPGHVVIVAECVQRFAEHQTALPALARAVSSHGPLPLPGLVREIFRQPIASHSEDSCLDTAFSALRSINSMEAFIEQNNFLMDSLEDLSDREVPDMPRASYVASAIMREARPRSPEVR